MMVEMGEEREKGLVGGTGKRKKVRLHECKGAQWKSTSGNRRESE